MIINPNQRYLIAGTEIEFDIIQYQEAIEFLKTFDHIDWDNIVNIVDNLHVGGKYWINDKTILVRLKDMIME